MLGSKQHWDRTYTEKAPAEVSWFERLPSASLALIEDARLAFDAAILDVGGGASRLAGELLAAGRSHITVADLSGAALARARSDLGPAAGGIDWIEADIRTHDFGRRFELWHDRAVFHFMVEPDDRRAYLHALDAALRPGGHVIIGVFGLQGPSRCSGLPVSRYAADGLARQLGDDYTLVSSRHQAHRTPAGNQQQFLYTHFRRCLP